MHSYVPRFAPNGKEDRYTWSMPLHKYFYYLRYLRFLVIPYPPRVYLFSILPVQIKVSILFFWLFFLDIKISSADQRQAPFLIRTTRNKIRNTRKKGEKKGKRGKSDKKRKMSEVNIPAKMKAIQVVEYKKPYEIREVSPLTNKPVFPLFVPFLVYSFLQANKKKTKIRKERKKTKME